MLEGIFYELFFNLVFFVKTFSLKFVFQVFKFKILNFHKLGQQLICLDNGFRSDLNGVPNLHFNKIIA